MVFYSLKRQQCRVKCCVLRFLKTDDSETILKFLDFSAKLQQLYNEDGMLIDVNV